MKEKTTSEIIEQIEELTNIENYSEHDIFNPIELFDNINDLLYELKTKI